MPGGTLPIKAAGFTGAAWVGIVVRDVLAAAEMPGWSSVFGDDSDFVISSLLIDVALILWEIEVVLVMISAAVEVF
jgi:hypothetical protein